VRVRVRSLARCSTVADYSDGCEGQEDCPNEQLCWLISLGVVADVSQIIFLHPARRSATAALPLAGHRRTGSNPTFAGLAP
jgi:hypothetical protein